MKPSVWHLKPKSQWPPNMAANLQQNGWKIIFLKTTFCVAMAQSKVQTSTWLKGRHLTELCTNQCPQNECWKEEWAKIPSEWYERLIKSYKKQAFQVFGCYCGSTGCWIVESLICVDNRWSKKTTKKSKQRKKETKKQKLSCASNWWPVWDGPQSW